MIDTKSLTWVGWIYGEEADEPLIHQLGITVLNKAPSGSKVAYFVRVTKEQLQKIQPLYGTWTWSFASPGQDDGCPF